MGSLGSKAVPAAMQPPGPGLVDLEDPIPGRLAMRAFASMLETRLRRCPSSNSKAEWLKNEFLLPPPFVLFRPKN